MDARGGGGGDVAAARRSGAGGGGMRLFSPEYYALCFGGGMLAAGTTHLAITPLDVLKVNMQVNPLKYNTIVSGLSVLVREEGASSLWRGWGGKIFGYGAQGGCKFGLYEYFKKRYSLRAFTQRCGCCRLQQAAPPHTSSLHGQSLSSCPAHPEQRGDVARRELARELSVVVGIEAQAAA